MAHEWIFEVLRDMRSYSQKNGLPALMAKLDETLQVALDEIGAPDVGRSSNDPDAQTE